MCDAFGLPSIPQATVALLLPKTTPASGVKSWTVSAVVAAAKNSAPPARSAPPPQESKPKALAQKVQPPVDPAKAEAAAKAKAAGDSAFALKDYEVCDRPCSDSASHALSRRAPMFEKLSPPRTCREPLLRTHRWVMTRPQEDSKVSTQNQIFDPPVAQKFTVLIAILRKSTSPLSQICAQYCKLLILSQKWLQTGPDLSDDRNFLHRIRGFLLVRVIISAHFCDRNPVSDHFVLVFLGA